MPLAARPECRRESPTNQPCPQSCHNEAVCPNAIRAGCLIEDRGSELREKWKLFKSAALSLAGYMQPSHTAGSIKLHRQPRRR